MNSVSDQAQLHIDLAALADNWRLLRDRFSGNDCGAVVKADAYGLGATEVVPVLRGAGCRRFFTAHLSEALAIRPHLSGASVAALNGLIAQDLPIYLETGIVPVLNDLGQIALWSQAAKAADRPLPAYIHIDTGMSRLGLPPLETAELIANRTQHLSGIDIVGWITHPACADEPDNPMTSAQFDRFIAATDQLPPAPRGFCNSAALFGDAAWNLDFCRPGIALYGGNPCPGRPNPMGQVVQLQARILQIRSIDASETVGYGASWRADRPRRIATIGVGYADGFHRVSGPSATVRIGSHRVPVVGRISMDLITLDVTDLPTGTAEVGSWVTLLGSGLTPQDLADAAQTIDYEVLTGLGRRYGRVYRKP